MTDYDFVMMGEAISLAEKCNPRDLDRIPMVGAVIAVDGTVIGRGSRGDGPPGDDEHAEFHAIKSVVDPRELPRATAYTTLEPCTRDVRSKGHLACTELLLQREIKKVYVGILDPNQGVCGKGVLELQKHAIEVELFPPELARNIRMLMAQFITAQQTLGARILSPAPGSMHELIRKTDGSFHVSVQLQCECINPPGPNVKIIVENRGSWYPQPNELRRIGDSNRWQAEMYFGGDGDHTIHIVRANQAGAILLSHYRAVTERNVLRTKEMKQRLETAGISTSLLDGLPGDYQGIGMPDLPKGLDSEDHVQIRLVRR